MSNLTNYRSVLLSRMPGELSPDLVDRMVRDLAYMARRVSPGQLSGRLDFYLAGILTARCYKAMNALEIATVSSQLAIEITDLLEKDIFEFIANPTAA
jgi:hypothetical protein